MKLTGLLFDVEGLDQPRSEIHEAVVTTKKIALDWDESGTPFHAVLHSKDGGINYSGTFGNPDPDPKCTMEATRFIAKDGQVLLWVTWENPYRGYAGHTFVHLASNWEE